MSHELVELLSSLVAIPSVNPMGRPVSGPLYGERRLTEYLLALFRQMGLPYQRRQVAPGRDNITARLDSAGSSSNGGPLILFSVHQDTVPVDGMTIDPFVPQVREGRLYGRGACDVKGGMAAMLHALRRLCKERPRGMPTIALACTVNEEFGFSGAQALARTCTEGSGGFIPRRPDAAIVAEPTGLNVVVAHKGVVRWRCHTVGRAGHSARPEAGQNAIYRMARTLMAIERYQGEVAKRLATHPLCGEPTVSVGTIHGGVSVNTIPDRCTIEIDRRLCPDESPEEARRHLVAYLDSQLGPDFPIEHDPPFMQGLALSDDINRPLAEKLAAIASQSTGQCLQIGVPYGTDASFLAAQAIPTVVFGPGSIDQAHTEDEWIALDQLDQAAEIYYQLGRRGIC